jgi:hypothetical protein
MRRPLQITSQKFTTAREPGDSRAKGCPPPLTSRYTKRSLRRQARASARGVNLVLYAVGSVAGVVNTDSHGPVARFRG